MGTSKSGRYLNTQGSGGSVSDFALVHSYEGTYMNVGVKNKKGQKFRLASGGHGEQGLKQLQKYGIEYHIVKTYPNGVRVGNVPGHKKSNKRSGTGQSWFPESWSKADVRRAGEHVAGLKGNRKIPDGKPIYGIYKGVRVGVMRTHGKIATVFPDSDQSAVLKRRNYK